MGHTYVVCGIGGCGRPEMREVTWGLWMFVRAITQHVCRVIAKRFCSEMEGRSLTKQGLKGRAMQGKSRAPTEHLHWPLLSINW